MLLFFVFFIPFDTKHSDSVNLSQLDKNVDLVLQSIKQNGKITAVTSNNSTNYFIYNGTPMGYQYELLNSFAKYLGVKLEIKVVNNLEKSFALLEHDKCDVLAVNLTVTKERTEKFNFTEPLCQTRQVLVQRKPENWIQMLPSEVENKLIRNQVQLSGKTVFVEKKSAFVKRLKNLSDEIGAPINIVEIPYYDTEQLITLVAEGEIDYTVCDENVGSVLMIYHQNIDIKTPISFSQNLSWAVNKKNIGLQTILNNWIRSYKNTESFRYTYNKYFKYNKATYAAVKESTIRHKGKISIFDDVIQANSKKINWDWRLLASLIYQESKFLHTAKARDGAFGLMQLMPGTAKRLGINRNATPEENVDAGVRYLQKIENEFKNISDPIEKTKFVLASYNAGSGHVVDAQKLAEKYGHNPLVWNEVKDFLLLKSKSDYFNDPVVKHGYYNGYHTIAFVQQILERFEHYKNTVKDEIVTN